MEFVGFLGCFKESIKIISSWWKIFTKITLTLILPLSFIFLFHIEISNILFRKIKHNAVQFNNTPEGSPRNQKLVNLMFSELGYLLLFKLIYFTFVLIFSLLSTSAVVYTTASIYTTKDAITFKKITSVVPKVWKRLIMTFYCAITEFVCYIAVTFAVLLTWFFTLQDRESGAATFTEFGCYTAVTYAFSVLLTWFFTLEDRESGAATFVLILDNDRDL